MQTIIDRLENKVVWTDIMSVCYRKVQNKGKVPFFHSSMASSAVSYEVGCWSISISTVNKRRLDGQITTPSNAQKAPLDSV